MILALVVFLFMLPLAWTLLASFDVTPDTATSPPTWFGPPSLGRYAEVAVAEPAFWHEMAASGLVSTTATLLAASVAFPASYGLARPARRRKGTFVQGFLILASVPVMAYVIPLGDVIRGLGLHDAFAGVVLSQTALFAPLGVYVLYGYLRLAPREPEEAALLDGANLSQILAHIVLPGNMAGLAATAIILFVLNWNSFLVPMVLTTSHVRTIPLAVSDFLVSDRELEWPTAAAALTASLLPLVVLVAVSHRALHRFVLGAAGRPEA